jgi:hypothetical protein
VRIESKRSDSLKEENDGDKDENVEKLLTKVSTIVSGPTKHYEMARRKIHRDINEFWFYMRSRLEQVRQQQLLL